MGNKQLPKLNPLKARSTVVAAVTFGALVAPSVFKGVDPDAAAKAAESAVGAINVLIGTGGLIWFWFERSAPFARLSFRGK